MNLGFGCYVIYHVFENAWKYFELKKKLLNFLKRYERYRAKVINYEEKT